MITESVNIERVLLIKGDPDAGKTTTMKMLYQRLSAAEGVSNIVFVPEPNRGDVSTDSDKRSDFDSNVNSNGDFCVVMTIKGKNIACLSFGDDWDYILGWFRKLKDVIIKEYNSRIDVYVGCCRRTNQSSYIGYTEHGLGNSKQSDPKFFNLQKVRSENANERERRENNLKDLLYRTIMDLIQR